jgi:LacI family transcriptional regulator
VNTQITIKDIAAKLGISPSTVSRALKDHPDISEATKKAVKELAEQWDYQPNSIALSLRSRKSNIIGVIVPQIVHNFFSTIISGIEDVAYKAGYNVMVCQTNERYEREVADINALVSSRAEGLLVSFSKETRDFDHLEKLQKKGIPLVFFDRICEEMDTSSVIVDDYGGAFRATEHLIEQGCTRIAHLAGPKHLMLSQNRMEGYMEALEKHGLPFREDYVVVCDGMTPDKGIEMTLHLLDLPEPPDGIFANNDMAGLGAIKATKSRGLRIPEDVAIVGYSDWMLTAMSEPSLSMIAQPGYEMGRVAAEILLRQIHTEPEARDYESRILETELIVRQSSLRKP